MHTLILKELTKEIIDVICKFNYLPEKIKDKFIMSIPIFNNGKLYYQTIYLENNKIQKREPTFSNLFSENNKIYKFIFDKYYPNGKILTKKEQLLLKARTKSIIRELKEYHLFDLCLSSRSIQKIKIDEIELSFKIDGENLIINKNIIYKEIHKDTNKKTILDFLKRRGD